MLSHFFTYLTQPFSASSGLSVLWLDFLSFVAIFVVVVTFANGFGIFARIGVIRRRHYVPPVMVERMEASTRCGWSRIHHKNLFLVGSDRAARQSFYW